MTYGRPDPGTRIIVNKRSVWPERVGCPGVVVGPPPGPEPFPPDGFPRGIGRSEVVVLLDLDPLRPDPDDDNVFVSCGHEDVWSCVMGIDALDPETPPPDEPGTGLDDDRACE